MLILTISGCTATPTRIESRAGMVQFQTGDNLRDYWLRVPAGDAGIAVPLVIVLHRDKSNGIRMASRGDFVRHATENGYVLAAPTAGSPGFAAEIENPDYLTDLITSASQTSPLPIDPDRIYLIGFSTGGDAALAMTARRTHPFAAVATVASLPPQDLPRDLPATSTLLIVGDSDPLIPMKGKRGADGWESLPPAGAFRRWAKFMGCDKAISSTVQFVRQTRRTGCRDDVSVQYLQVGGLGHHWPKPFASDVPQLQNPKYGPYQPQLDATALIWHFFEQTSASEAGGSL